MGSTAAQEDINRLRALLDAERSRRVAAEGALGGGGPVRRVSGNSTPTSVGTGTPRSRSYSSFHKSAMVRAVEAHTQGTAMPTSVSGAERAPGPGSDALGEGPPPPPMSSGMLTPPTSSRQHPHGGNAMKHVGTPRCPRLSYSSLHKFPSARTVEAHALEAAANGAKWVRTALARAAKSSGGGSGPGRGGGREKEDQRLLVRGAGQGEVGRGGVVPVFFFLCVWTKSLSYVGS